MAKGTTKNPYPENFSKENELRSQYGLFGEHKAKVKTAAIRRAETQYPKVSIRGVIYPNMVHASKAIGMSPREIGRRARDPRPEWGFIFFVEDRNE